MDQNVVVLVLAGCIVAIGAIWVVFKRASASAAKPGDTKAPEHAAK
jgi:hypothetical protein